MRPIVNKYYFCPSDICKVNKLNKITEVQNSYQYLTPCNIFRLAKKFFRCLQTHENWCTLGVLQRCQYYEEREKTNKMQQSDVYYKNCLNMFRASLWPSSGEQRPVCYCKWCAALVLLDVVGSGCGALRCRVRALLSDVTRGCVIQFWPPDDEHMCSKYVEAWNKLTVKQNFVHQVGSILR